MPSKIDSNPNRITAQTLTNLVENKDLFCVVHYRTELESTLSLVENTDTRTATCGAVFLAIHLSSGKTLLIPHMDTLVGKTPKSEDEMKMFKFAQNNFCCIIKEPSAVGVIRIGNSHLGSGDDKSEGFVTMVFSKSMGRAEFDALCSSPITPKS